ncbi:hypothetical protein MKW94_016058 [Papaver nudicaule]|uniref:Protein kinase domain-containing protein n=1 Tax=Papaver nudicaule TaxID=74823 RepID=A0AA41V924_PAPNU|nr:hypothetical protein [Papaver nudicaule]
MARFRLFSCIRSTKEHSSYSQRRDDYDQAEFPFISDANVRVFEPTEPIVSTDTFAPSRVIGEGRLGRVYKGILQDGQEVAVKRFHAQADLWVEVRMLRRVDHSNLIKMIGYCDKGEDHIIVYDFMPLQSLNLHLQDLQPGKKPLDWKTRMKIAEGVAKALEYLHDQKDPPVIYGGLSRTCILLDESYNPKLSDFSCAKDGPVGDYTLMYMKMLETYGYVDPEICMTGHLTLKSDVYSFGVLLLELISGEKAFEYNIRGSGMHTITAWAQPLIDSKEFQEIVDPLIEGQYPYLGLVQALGLAKMCVQYEAHERPRMAEVMTTLSNLVSQTYEEVQGIQPKADPCCVVHKQLDR